MNISLSIVAVTSMVVKREVNYKRAYYILFLIELHEQICFRDRLLWKKQHCNKTIGLTV